jgi:uncharacterized LabA/DUF88 family protein
MSSTALPQANATVQNKIRVIAFIDGFNLYHALDEYTRGATPEEKVKYKKYKWLCLTSLMKVFVRPVTEELAGVEYFTTYPSWNTAKLARHRTFVTAQIKMGVHVTFGEFKEKTVRCRADCMAEYKAYEEKQTDINIATSMIDFASRYDKLILVTADSDQVPALKLLKKLHPEKRLASLPPIGREAKELAQVCHESFKMTEEHLIANQLPTPIPLMHNGQQYGVLEKPQGW